MASFLPTRYPEESSRGSVPPIMTVGSFSAAMRIWVHMDVVVVFPWVPAIQMEFS